MLYRKIEKQIKDYLESSDNKVLLVEGARQVGKSYIIRHVCSAMYENYIEINMVEDRENSQSFATAKSLEDFYFVLSTVAGEKLRNATRENTVVFLR